MNPNKKGKPLLRVFDSINICRFFELPMKKSAFRIIFNPLSANPTKWSKHTQTIRQQIA